MKKRLVIWVLAAIIYDGCSPLTKREQALFALVVGAAVYNKQ